jgi:DNA polymerase
MPHTSPLAWNRKAPDGTKWSEVGARQIALAVGLRTRGDNHVL